jgi:hypothetical protein
MIGEQLQSLVERVGWKFLKNFLSGISKHQPRR